MVIEYPLGFEQPMKQRDALQSGGRRVRGRSVSTRLSLFETSSSRGLTRFPIVVDCFIPCSVGSLSEHLHCASVYGAGEEVEKVSFSLRRRVERLRDAFDFFSFSTNHLCSFIQLSGAPQGEL